MYSQCSSGSNCNLDKLNYEIDDKQGARVVLGATEWNYFIIRTLQSVHWTLLFCVVTGLN